MKELFSQPAPEEHNLAGEEPQLAAAMESELEARLAD